MDETKTCPFCGEQILAVAVKCKHCQSMLATVSGQTAAVAVVAPAEPLSTATLSPDRTTVLIAYGLYGLGVFLVVPSFIALFINYMKRDEAKPPYDSHHRWMIGTTWWWFLWGAIGFVTTFVGIGYLIILGCWMWVIYRFSKGLLAAIEGSAVNGRVGSQNVAAEVVGAESLLAIARANGSSLILAAWIGKVIVFGMHLLRQFGLFGGIGSFAKLFWADWCLELLLAAGSAILGWGDKGRSSRNFWQLAAGCLVVNALVRGSSWFGGALMPLGALPIFEAVWSVAFVAASVSMSQAMLLPNRNSITAGIGLAFMLAAAGLWYGAERELIFANTLVWLMRCVGATAFAICLGGIVAGDRSRRAFAASGAKPNDNFANVQVAASPTDADSVHKAVTRPHDVEASRATVTKDGHEGLPPDRYRDDATAAAFSPSVRAKLSDNVQMLLTAGAVIAAFGVLSIVLAR